jgi:hypothetical protein
MKEGYEGRTQRKDMKEGNKGRKRRKDTKEGRKEGTNEGK